MSAKFHVHNLGCKLNRVESDSIAAALLTAGARQVKRSSAEVIIINTCTVTAEADAKTRKAVRQALAEEHNPWVIATGCSVAIDKDSLSSLSKRVIAEPDRELAKLKALEILRCANDDSVIDDSSSTITEDCSAGKDVFAYRSKDVSEDFSAQALSANQEPQSIAHRIGADFNTRVGIKIQDGCDNACTYCIVCIARGAARSLPYTDIVHQIVEAENCGVREVILTGVNIGAYVSSGKNLGALLNLILATTSKLRIRLSSLEPQHVDDELIMLMAKSDGRICAHLHLPLQSGSDKILKLMNRRYDKAFFAERVAFARKLMPQIAITTDLIVGFPSENEADFLESLAFCKQMAFARMHVFRYSKRPNTIAATMPNQIASHLIAKRATTARELATKMQLDDLQARIFTTEQVLIERVGRGTSESYHSVILSDDRRDLAVGSLVKLKFVCVENNSLLSS